MLGKLFPRSAHHCFACTSHWLRVQPGCSQLTGQCSVSLCMVSGGMAMQTQHGDFECSCRLISQEAIRLAVFFLSYAARSLRSRFRATT